MKRSRPRPRLSRPRLVLLCLAVASTTLVVALAASGSNPGRLLSGGPAGKNLASPANRAKATAQSEFATINDLRARNGLRPLDFSASAARIARRHSLAVATSHQSPADRCLDCLAWQMGWVNTLEITGNGTSIQAVNAQLLGSRSQTASLLCRCVTMGAAGVVRASGRFWVTELIYRPAPAVLFGAAAKPRASDPERSEEHTSEL